MLQVSPDFLLALSAIFSSGWRIFVSFQIPGTNINVAEFVFGCFMVVFVIKVVPHFLGIASIFERFGLDGGDGNPRTGQNSSGRSDGNDRGVGRW